MRSTYRLSVLSVLLSFVAGCGDPAPAPGPEDGGTRDAGRDACGADSECDDAVFCNGAETCSPDAPGADARGCMPGAPPCATDAICDEDAETCTPICDARPDGDGDGERSTLCGGNDCDDDDPQRYPGNDEVCDPFDRDEDCDPRTYGQRDRDDDGFPDALCCNVDGEGERICGVDCDDTLPSVHPTQAETCDTLDNDCDGLTDEGQRVRYHRDQDGDGFGVESEASVETCPAMRPTGFVDLAEDCDDTVRGRNPGQAEVCDLIPDNDCNPATNPFDADLDGHDRAACGGDDCDDAVATTYGGAPELCNLVDDDCSRSGVTDFGEDVDGDGHAPAGLCTGGALPADDCDDARGYVHGGGVEHCNALDDDCSASTPAAGACRAVAISSGFAFARPGSSSWLRVADTLSDGDGNIVVAGHFGWTIDFGGGEVALGTNFPNGFVASYTGAGAFRWVRTFGGPGWDEVNALARLADGTLVVVGSFERTATFGSATLTEASGTTSRADLFVLPVSAAGVLGTPVAISGAGDETLGDVAVSPAGDVWVAGCSSGSTTIAFAAGATHPVPASGCYVVRTDTAGTLRGSSPGARGASLAYQPSSGRLYVASNPWSGGQPTVEARSSAGVTEWTLTLAGDFGFGEEISDLAIDASGNVLVAGLSSTHSRLGSVALAGPAAFVASVSPAGAVRWARTITGGTDSVETPRVLAAGDHAVLAARLVDETDVLGHVLPDGQWHSVVASFSTDAGALLGHVSWAEPEVSGYGASFDALALGVSGAQLLVAGGCRADDTGPDAAWSPCEGFVARLTH